MRHVLTRQQLHDDMLTVILTGNGMLDEFSQS